MALLTASDVSIDLPEGWDGQIRRAGPPAEAPPGSRSAAGAASADAAGPVVLHAASFALPSERGDYGSGAVEVMAGSDVLVCLLEHEPEAAGTVLFRRHGMPRLRSDRFSPQAMQRAIPGMAGTQHFFQVAGRPFCLYVVIGSWATRGPLVRAADDAVRRIRIGA